jgi:hypothetical protein
MCAIMSACIYVHMRAIICSRIHTHRRNHACKNMYTFAQSFARVYTRISVNMFTFVCTRRRNHACSCLGGMIFAVDSRTRSGLEYHVLLNTLSSQLFLCTTWLDPKTLALLPGFCIATPLLPVLEHVCSRPHLMLP